MAPAAQGRPGCAKRKGAGCDHTEQYGRMAQAARSLQKELSGSLAVQRYLPQGAFFIAPW